MCRAMIMTLIRVNAAPSETLVVFMPKLLLFANLILQALSSARPRCNIVSHSLRTKRRSMLLLLPTSKGAHSARKPGIVSSFQSPTSS